MAGAPYEWGEQPALAKQSSQLTVDSTSGGVAFSGVTNGVPAGCVGAVCTVETAAIRTTEDGATAPTTTVGTLWNPGDRFVVWGSQNVNHFKAIRTTTTSGALDIEFLVHSAGA